jgi:hypothetical protein
MILSGTHSHTLGECGYPLFWVQLGTSPGSREEKEVCCAVKRIILVLTVTAMILVTMVAGAGSPAMAQDEPGAPQCSWYYNTADRDAWWEYWCWWPGWGWEFVFWVWD